MASHAHGWSDLPADVLATVFDGLTIRALIRAGAVCRWWNAASSYVQTHHRVLSHRQTPCLLYKSTSSSNSDTATLYSITDRRSYTVPFSTGANIIPDWYLVYPYDCSLQVRALVNPGFTVDAGELADYLYLRALVSSDPSSDGDCVVVLIHRPHFQLSYARPGDAHWTWIRAPPDNTQYCDCAFDVDGRTTLYAMRHDGAIHAFDLHGRRPLGREVVLCPQVAVWRHMESTVPGAVAKADLDKDVWKTESIKVYRVDLAAQTLVEIKDLGGHSLFVGCNHTFSLMAKDCPGTLPNHVYYTDNEEHYALYTPQCPRDIGVYNVGDGSFHDIHPTCPWSNWPLPAWITPSLAYKTEQ
ncbi:hypothetical protein EJB05_41820, partial [Eragrostis curvula]